VQSRECENAPRPSVTGDVLRRIADYAAGYADAQAERVADD
jgi:dGTP triphosphohydrolase